MQITRIKAGRSSHTITLQEIVDESTRRESRVTVGQGVDPEFADAMQGLLPEAMGFIGAPAVWADGAQVTGVSITWDKSELAGAVVSFSVPIDGANGPLNISTPYAAITDDNTGLPKVLVERIDDLMDVAEKLVRTVAKQHELF